MNEARTVLITGGTGGLGVATVTAFVADGWRVVAPVRPGSGDRLPDGAIAVETDLTVAAAVGAAAEVAAGEASAPLRAVVNLAGGFAAGGLVGETPVEDFEAMLR